MFAAFVFVAVGLAQTSVPSAPTSPQTEIQSTAPSPADIEGIKSKAAAGDAAAQLALGRAYENGAGIRQSDEQAAIWYRKAADQGNAEAQNLIGVFYRTGRGVDKNLDEALRWYRKAAHQGNSAAMFNIGGMYYNGDGVPIDDTLAFRWFIAAQEHGSASAADAVKRGNDELKNFQKIDSLFQLGAMYHDGEEVPQDFVAAAKWYRAAAAAGSVAAKVNLASMMIMGEGVKQDIAEGKRNCEDAAKHNYSPGAFCLGLMYRSDVGGPKDESTAIKWFTRAAEMGHSKAMLYLGQDYLTGNGTRVDLEKAYMWLRLSDSAGNHDARQFLDRLHGEMNESQVKRAEKKAANWQNQHPMIGLRSAATN